MSAIMMIKAWEQRGLTPAERLVLMSLADSADRDGRNAFPGQHRIAEHCQLDVRTVRRAFRALERRSVIAMQEPARRHRPTTYLLFPGRADIVSGLCSDQGRTFDRDQMSGRPDISSSPPTPPYKEDPVLDPVDPATLRLLERTATQFLRHNIVGNELLTRMVRWGRGRVPEATLRLVVRKVESA